MKIRSPLIHRTLGFCGAMLLRGWMATLECKVVYHDPTVDPVHPNCRQRYIFLSWHEYMLATVTTRGNCGMTVLASQHEDAAVMRHAARNLGWEIIKGSTTRGGLSALRGMMRVNEAHLNFTPDGPRGPRRTVAPGAIFLAAKLGMPLVCCAYAYDRPRRFDSWDRFAMPRPFSRLRGVIGPPVTVPTKLDRDGLEEYRLLIEGQLNQFTLEAEAWAESGKHREGEMPLLHRRPAPQMLTGTDLIGKHVTPPTFNEAQNQAA